MDKKKLWLLLGALALALALVLVLVLGLKKGPKAPAEQKEKKLPQIGLCLRQHEENPDYGKCLEKKLKEAGYEVLLQDARNDQTRQTKQIKSLLSEGVVLLVIEPVIADEMENTAPLLKEKNIPAVFIGSKPEAALQLWNKLSFVGIAEDQLGDLQGQIILQTEARGDLNEDGQVSCLVLTGPEDDKNAQRQTKGSMDALVAEGLLVEQVEVSWGDWTEESGKMRCAKSLSQYGKDIDVILCGDEAITLGALDAIETGGWQVGRDYLLVGIGAEDALKSGGLTGTVVYDWDGAAEKVLSVAQDLLAGKGAAQENYVNLKAVTAEVEPE